MFMKSSIEGLFKLDFVGRFQFWFVSVQCSTLYEAQIKLMKLLQHASSKVEVSLSARYADISCTWLSTTPLRRTGWVVSFTSRPHYPQGSNSRYPLERKLCGPQSPSGNCDEEKNPNPCLESNSGHPSCSPVTIL